jgi:hypothetical protein
MAWQRRQDEHSSYDVPSSVCGGDVGAAGLYSVAGFAGLLNVLICFFFGFFFSRPRLSRLPMTCSSQVVYSGRSFPVTAGAFSFFAARPFPLPGPTSRLHAGLSRRTGSHQLANRCAGMLVGLWKTVRVFKCFCVPE